MFDPKTFLGVAEQVLSAPADEASQRSAINRAYYAAFLVAREYVLQRNIMSRPPAGRRWGSYERVIFSIGAVRHPSARPIRQTLFRLKKLRTNADYDLNYAYAELDSRRALQDTATIIAWIDELP